MKVSVFAVRDVRLDEFLPPFVAPNDAIGERMFADAVRAQGSLFAKNPDDYVLYRLGSWNSHDGTFDLASFEAEGGVHIFGYARDYVVKE